MLDQEAPTILLFDHIIMEAEQSLVAAVARPTLDDDLCKQQAEVADRYDQRRLILEEMMHLPFRSARD